MGIDKIFMISAIILFICSIVILVISFSIFKIKVENDKKRMDFVNGDYESIRKIYEKEALRAGENIIIDPTISYMRFKLKEYRELRYIKK